MHAPSPQPQATTPLDLLASLAAQHQRLNAALERTGRHEWRNQYHRDLSPIGWHYAHCHFVEAAWLHERVLDETTSNTRDWHDLYLPELSPKWRRGGRLPPRDRMLAWGRRCQDRHLHLLREDPRVHRHALLEGHYLTGFLAQHHAMHLESLEQVRWFARLQGSPCPSAGAPPPPRMTAASEWRRFPDPSRHTTGSEAVTAFDNEQGVHGVDLAPYAIASRPVSNAWIIAFIEAGGYRPGPHWDEAGRAWLERTGVAAPLGWQRTPEGGFVQTLPDGTHRLNPEAAAVGLSWYEAAAFARWAGARLPHEHEWEHAAQAGVLHGTGQVWEWCANRFYPYPGFRPFPYDAYSRPWFDDRHYVLRGGSAWSDPLLARTTLRNFFTPDKRHVFAGIRLARSL
ncbi:MAG: SUMF1/EgtB/PvdO family nonheme iron enzyme [Thioalkalivibrio sp.]|nr:SUMF1/EgtB/PvdO family nonheme iron enzyme [Thioalkalivibrio sp.]